MVEVYKENKNHYKIVKSIFKDIIGNIILYNPNDEKKIWES